MNTIKFNETELFNLERDLIKKYKHLKKKADKLEFLLYKFDSISDISEEEFIKNLIFIKAKKAVNIIEKQKTELDLLKGINNDKKIDKKPDEIYTKKANVKNKHVLQTKKMKKTKVINKLSEQEIVKPQIIINKTQNADLNNNILNEKMFSEIVTTHNVKIQTNPEKTTTNFSSIRKDKKIKIIKSPRKIRLEQSKWRKFNWRTWAKTLLVDNGEQMNFDEMFNAFNQKYLFSGEDLSIARKGLLEGLLKLVKSGEVIKYSSSNKPNNVMYGLKRWEKFI